MTETNELLEQGIAALKAGHKAEARSLLMQVVEQDERNERAWLWLSGAVDTDEERRTCLENVLAINPNNGMARRGLEHLLASKGVRQLSAVSPPTPSAEPAPTPREQPPQPPVEVSAPNVTQRKKRRKLTKQRMGLIIAFVIVIAPIVAYLAITRLTGPYSSPERVVEAFLVAANGESDENSSDFLTQDAIIIYSVGVRETMALLSVSGTPKAGELVVKKSRSSTSTAEVIWGHYAFVVERHWGKWYIYCIAEYKDTVDSCYTTR
jgi:hypothetical protein